MTERKLYLESVKERVCGMVTASNSIREATEMEIADAQFKYIETGVCDHSGNELIVYDEPGFMYSIRSCGICDAGLGAI